MIQEKEKIERIEKENYIYFYEDSNSYSKKEKNIISEESNDSFDDIILKN